MQTSESRQRQAQSFTIDIRTHPIMKTRQQLLTDALESRILVLDGSMGQLLQSQMTIADYGGAHLENLTDYVTKIRPDVVAGIHQMYLEAGSDIIQPKKINGNEVALEEFHV